MALAKTFTREGLKGSFTPRGSDEPGWINDGEEEGTKGAIATLVSIDPPRR